MPTYLKVAISLCAEVSIVVLRGVIGAWLPPRNITAGEGGGPKDGIGAVLFGGLGMIIAGMVSVVSIIVLWSVLAMRREAVVRETGGSKPSAPKAEGVWPPPPRY